MNRGVLIWGYFSSFLLLLGAIFMNSDLAAGKVLYLTGFFAFNLGYLIPLFLNIFQENQENKIGVVLVFGVLGFLCFLTGVSFFMVNWGGGIILIYIGGGILILAILSIIIFSRRFYETHIDSWFPVLIFGVFIVVSLLTGMVHRHVMRVFTVNNYESAELLLAIKQQNQKVFDLIIEEASNDSLFRESMPHVYRIQKETAELNRFIESLKIDLLSEVEGKEYKLFDDKPVLNLVPIQSNVEINSVSHFMLGKKSGKAYDLKEAIVAYRNSMETLVPENEKWLQEYIQKSLNTESYGLRKRRYNKSWEYQHFYKLPLITVINQLTQVQYKIYVVERELLHYFNLTHTEMGTLEKDSLSILP